MGQIKDPVVKSALEEIQRASQEVDIVQIANNFTINGAFTTTRTLNNGTQTLAEVYNILSTLLKDMAKGGMNRTT